jgi:hypothetical protein
MCRVAQHRVAGDGHQALRGAHAEWTALLNEGVEFTRKPFLGADEHTVMIGVGPDVAAAAAVEPSFARW